MQSTYASQTHGLIRLTRKKQRSGSEYNENHIDFCIMVKVDHKFLKNVKVITGEFAA